MNQLPLEIECKFYLANLAAFERKVKAAGAELVHPRTFELNLIFDTADGTLKRGHRVLRLRRDERIRLTLKGESTQLDGATSRPEIEFGVDDFYAAQQLLEALGFHVALRVEKWRTTYSLNGNEVALDEMPFGNFNEIEGDYPATIRQTAASLDLDWEKRVASGYLHLFNDLVESKTLGVKNLSFDDFRELTVTPADLGVSPADLP